MADSPKPKPNNKKALKRVLVDSGLSPSIDGEMLQTLSAELTFWFLRCQ